MRPWLPVLLLGVLGDAALGAESPLVLQHLQCRGDQPRWSIDANATTALVGLPDGETVRRGTLMELRGPAPGWALFRGEDVALVARSEPCEGAGEAFAYVALVLLDEATVLTGCCHARIGLDLEEAPLAPVSDKPAEDWSRYALDLATVLRACVIDGGVLAQQVSVAWPMNHGLAGVRLVTGDGERHDCIADIASGRIERVEPVAAAERMPNEGEPSFWPAREAWPLFTCGRAEELRGANGDRLGWLHYGGPCR